MCVCGLSVMLPRYWPVCMCVFDEYVLALQTKPNQGTVFYGALVIVIEIQYLHLFLVYNILSIHTHTIIDLISYTCVSNSVFHLMYVPICLM